MLTHFIRYTATVLIVVLLQACGGGSTGSGSTTASVGPAATVSGVAATGAAMDGIVTLKDSTGITRTASISQPSGTFSMDVTGLTPPYFLKATNNAGTLTLYSVASGSGTFNINPLSNLVAVAAAMSIDPLAKSPDEAFNNPANFSTLTAAQIQAATDSVMAQMSPAFQAALTANGASSVNPLTDSFQIGNGLDKVFDGFVVTLNTATGEVQEHQVASNTTMLLGLVDKLGAFPAAGVYDGTVDTTQSGGGIHQVHDMLITSSGEMRYVMDNGVIVTVALTASGSTVIGTGKAYAPTLNGQPVNFQFADGSTTDINLTINGTLGTGTLSGTYTYGNYTDTFSFTLNAQQTNSTASLDKIAGTYASSLDSNTVFIGHIDANGKIWGSGSGIAYSGLIQVVDPNANIYRVTLAYLNQNDTASFVSGLATFYGVSPTIDTLPKPTTLVPNGYTGEIASLNYNQAVAGSHGKFLMQLSSPLQQIFISAVRMSTQQQTIAVQPTPDSLMVQAVGNTAFSVTTTGDIQYSGSGEAFGNSGLISSSAGSINVIGNIGNFALNGTQVVSIPSFPTLNPGILQLGQWTNWQQYSILTNSYALNGSLCLNGTFSGAWAMAAGQGSLTSEDSTGTSSTGGLVNYSVGGLAGYSAGTITNGYVSGDSVSEVYSVGGLTAPTNVQITPGAIINWQSFNISSSEAVLFAQPSATVAVLNQVTNSNNYITGTLSTNSGNILLTQASGVVVGGLTNLSAAGTAGATISGVTLSAGP